MSNVFINRALRKDIPSDAVILTRTEALDLQWGIVKNWKQRSLTWPFNIGFGVLASLNAATNLTFIQHCRNKLLLGNYGRITLALPAVFLPSIASVVGHRLYVVDEILLGQECPLCIQVRAAALQAGLGVALPLVTTPIAAFYYAYNYATYDVPFFKFKNLPKIFSLWLEVIMKFRALPTVLAINTVAAAALTYFEADSFYKIQTAVYENEQRFRRSIADRAGENL